MRAALSEQPVTTYSRHISKLIDHRYFYDEDDPKSKQRVAHYSCGLSRDAVTQMLLAKRVNLCTHDFLKSLPQYITNPSVAGYMIEKAILSSISLTGLNIRDETSRGMDVVFFNGEIPKLLPTEEKEGPVLHIPLGFNCKAIDGVIVWSETGQKKPETGQKKRRLFILPLQITVAKTHSNSHKKFFKEWEKWIIGLDRFEVVPEFVWIDEHGGSTNDFVECSDWPAHKEWKVAIGHVSVLIENLYNIAKRQIPPGKPGSSENKEDQEGPKEGGIIDYKKLKVPELRSMLRLRSFPCSGMKRDDMIAHLQEYDERQIPPENQGAGRTRRTKKSQRRRV